MLHHDIIVMGASVGGMEAFKNLVRHFPPDLAAAVFIVWHISPITRSILPTILSKAGKLPARHGVDGEPIRHGRIYVAPPDHHLMLEADHVRLTRAPKENRFRPALDPLFRSAAYAFGPRVVGVMLTGALDDGTAGLWAIKDRGGIAIVQEPTEAQDPSMPRSALQHVRVDYCLPIAEIAQTLVRLTKESVSEEKDYPISTELEIETQIGMQNKGLQMGVMKLGECSAFTCPECHGALLQITNGSLTRFRCHTGHAFSMESLLAALGEVSENALWNALRAVEESVILLAHMEQHASSVNQRKLAALLKTQVQQAQRRADMVREIVMQHDAITRYKLEREVEEKLEGSS